MKIFITSLTIISSAAVALAQVNDQPVRDIINLGGFTVSSLIPIAVSLAVLAFFWYLVKFIWMASDNPEAQSKAKSGIFYSIFAIFVMVSIWGIVGLMQGTLGINSRAERPEVNPLPPNMRQ
jgi:hypothetical protein